MDKERLLWADSLKGLLMLLVIIGHAIQVVLKGDCFNNHIWNLIYSFHMPAFVAISGWFSYREKRKKSSYLKSCIRRAHQLLIPYICWSLISCVLGGLTLKRLSYIILSPDTYFWFLWVLFWICCLFVLAQRIADWLKIDEFIPIALVGLLLIILMVFLDLRIFGYQFLAYYFLFYVLGYCIHRFKFLKLKRSVVLALFAVLWGAMAWFWNMHKLPTWISPTSYIPDFILQYIYRGVTAVLAVLVLFGLAPRLLNANTRVNIWFTKLGAFSLGIYVSHLIIINYIYDFVQLFIPCPPVWCTIGIISILTFILSFLIVKILVRTRWTARVLLGKI